MSTIDDIVRDWPHAEAVTEDRAGPPVLDAALRREYTQLFGSLVVRPARRKSVSEIADRIVANQKRYASVERSTHVPWYVIALIHLMEIGLSFGGHLHNGDPLTARTVHVPVGRPPNGKPPFTWEESARDALGYEHFDGWQDWTLPGILYKLEAYNGFGYRLHHAECRSPYLWSFSTHYTKGKYAADGQFDPNLTSQQCGAAVALDALVDRGAVVLDGHAEPLVAWSGERVHPSGVKLQRFLNSFPAIALVEDGKLGRKSSDALRVVAGHRLKGDPRH